MMHAEDSGWLWNTSTTKQNTWCRIIESRVGLGKDFLLPGGRRENMPQKGVLVKGYC